MSRISQQIEVDVPVRVAYDQWTQFESFPQFMDGVERVEQVDDKTLDWTAEIAGHRKQWRAEIVEQEPDAVVSWRSVAGARNDGAVRFEPIGPNGTRITLELDVEPDGALEAAGDALGFVDRQAKGDMERFKAFIESRGVPTGAWRGSIDGGRVEDGGGPSSGGGR